LLDDKKLERKGKVVGPKNTREDVDIGSEKAGERDRESERRERRERESRLLPSS
jgi:hypothetical protein